MLNHFFSFLLITSLFAITSCSNGSYSDKATIKNTQNLMSLMEGVYQTEPDDPDNNFIDTRIRIKSLGEGQWVYYRLNTGPERKVYRLRVFQYQDLPTGGVIQTVWDFKEPEKYGSVSTASDLDDLSLSELKPWQSSGCNKIWNFDQQRADGSWVGIVDPAKCKIFSKKRQSNISVKAESILNEEQLLQTEKGFDQNGVQLFGGSEGSYIVLRRQNSAN